MSGQGAARVIDSYGMTNSAATRTLPHRASAQIGVRRRDFTAIKKRRKKQATSRSPLQELATEFQTNPRLTSKYTVEVHPTSLVVEWKSGVRQVMVKLFLLGGTAAGVLLVLGRSSLWLWAALLSLGVVLMTYREGRYRVRIDRFNPVVPKLAEHSVRIRYEASGLGVSYNESTARFANICKHLEEIHRILRRETILLEKTTHPSACDMLVKRVRRGA